MNVDNIKEKYPGYIPIKLKTKNSSIQLQNEKYIVKNDITLGQFLFTVRKRSILNLDPNEAIYAFINNNLYPVSMNLSQIYMNERTNKKKDELLEITICKENTFGSN